MVRWGSHILRLCVRYVHLDLMHDWARWENVKVYLCSDVLPQAAACSRSVWQSTEAWNNSFTAHHFMSIAYSIVKPGWDLMLNPLLLRATWSVGCTYSMLPVAVLGREWLLELGKNWAFLIFLWRHFDVMFAGNWRRFLWRERFGLKFGIWGIIISDFEGLRYTMAQ